MKNILLIAFVLLVTYVNAQITNPAPYCSAIPRVAGSPYKGGIKNVNISTLNNPSGFTGTYIYYNSVSAPVLYRGAVYTLTVVFDSVEGGTDPTYYGGWIDFNRNNQFNGFGSTPFDEVVLFDTVAYYTGAPPGSTVTKSRTFSVPNSSSLGVTRMRIARSAKCMAFTGSVSYFLTPCDCSTTPSLFGETEDYDIEIRDASSLLVNDLVRKENARPNPTTGILNITAPIGSRVHLTNPVGQIMYSGIDTQINISNLPNGIYYLNVNGETSVIQKQ